MRAAAPPVAGAASALRRRGRRYGFYIGCDEVVAVIVAFPQVHRHGLAGFGARALEVGRAQLRLEELVGGALIDEDFMRVAFAVPDQFSCVVGGSLCRDGTKLLR